MFFSAVGHVQGLVDGVDAIVDEFCIGHAVEHVSRREFLCWQCVEGVSQLFVVCASEEFGEYASRNVLYDDVGVVGGDAHLDVHRVHLAVRRGDGVVVEVHFTLVVATHLAHVGECLFVGDGLGVRVIVVAQA